MSKQEAQGEKDALAQVANMIDAHEQGHITYQQSLKDQIDGLTKTVQQQSRDLTDAQAEAADWKSKYMALLGEQHPTGPRFPGDPGRGNYIIGWSLKRKSNTGWDLIELLSGKVPGFDRSKTSLIHDYASSTAKFLDRTSAQEVISNGFKVVSQSCKMLGISGTFATAANSVMSGAQDQVLKADADFMKANPNVAFWIAVYHEPEDLTGANQKLLRDVTRYIVTFMRGQDVANVVFQPVYQVPYTFTNRDYRVWHPDWRSANDWYTGPDSVCGLFGGDTYNPLPGGKANHAYSAMWASAQAKIKAAGQVDQPKTNMEFGMGRVVPPNGWDGWASDVIEYSKANDIIAISEWDNSTDVGRYSYTDPDKLKAWNMIQAAATVL